MREPSEEGLITAGELADVVEEMVLTHTAETIRIKMKQAINEDALPLDELKRRHGDVWTTTELQQQFEVVGFGAPLAVVRRRSDNKLGSVLFQHQPRFYWGFKEDRV